MHVLAIIQPHCANIKPKAKRSEMENLRAKILLLLALLTVAHSLTQFQKQGHASPSAKQSASSSAFTITLLFSGQLQPFTNTNQYTATFTELSGGQPTGTIITATFPLGQAVSVVALPEAEYSVGLSIPTSPCGGSRATNLVFATASLTHSADGTTFNAELSDSFAVVSGELFLNGDRADPSTYTTSLDIDGSERMVSSPGPYLLLHPAVNSCPVAVVVDRTDVENFAQEDFTSDQPGRERNIDVNRSTGSFQIVYRHLDDDLSTLRAFGDGTSIIPHVTLDCSGRVVQLLHKTLFAPSAIYDLPQSANECSAQALLLASQSCSASDIVIDSFSVFISTSPVVRVINLEGVFSRLSGTFLLNDAAPPLDFSLNVILPEGNVPERTFSYPLGSYDCLLEIACRIHLTVDHGPTRCLGELLDVQPRSSDPIALDIAAQSAQMVLKLEFIGQPISAFGITGEAGDYPVVTLDYSQRLCSPVIVPPPLIDEFAVQVPTGSVAVLAQTPLTCDNSPLTLRSFTTSLDQNSSLDVNMELGELLGVITGTLVINTERQLGTDFTMVLTTPTTSLPSPPGPWTRLAPANCPLRLTVGDDSALTSGISAGQVTPVDVFSTQTVDQGIVVVSLSWNSQIVDAFPLTDLNEGLAVALRYRVTPDGGNPTDTLAIEPTIAVNAGQNTNIELFIDGEDSCSGSRVTIATFDVNVEAGARESVTAEIGGEYALVSGQLIVNCLRVNPAVDDFELFSSSFGTSSNPFMRFVPACNPLTGTVRYSNIPNFATFQETLAPGQHTEVLLDITVGNLSVEFNHAGSQLPDQPATFTVTAVRPDGTRALLPYPNLAAQLSASLAVGVYEVEVERAAPFTCTGAELLERIGFEIVAEEQTVLNIDIGPHFAQVRANLQNNDGSLFPDAAIVTFSLNNKIVHTTTETHAAILGDCPTLVQATQNDITAQSFRSGFQVSSLIDVDLSADQVGTAQLRLNFAGTLLTDIHTVEGPDGLYSQPFPLNNTPFFKFRLQDVQTLSTTIVGSTQPVVEVLLPAATYRVSTLLDALYVCEATAQDLSVDQVTIDITSDTATPVEVDVAVGMGLIVGEVKFDSLEDRTPDAVSVSYSATQFALTSPFHWFVDANCGSDVTARVGDMPAAQRIFLVSEAQTITNADFDLQSTTLIVNMRLGSTPVSLAELSEWTVPAQPSLTPLQLTIGVGNENTVLDLPLLDSQQVVIGQSSLVEFFVRVHPALRCATSQASAVSFETDLTNQSTFQIDLDLMSLFASIQGKVTINGNGITESQGLSDTTVDVRYFGEAAFLTTPTPYRVLVDGTCAQEVVLEAPMLNFAQNFIISNSATVVTSDDVTVDLDVQAGQVSVTALFNTRPATELALNHGKDRPVTLRIFDEQLTTFFWDRESWNGEDVFFVPLSLTLTIEVVLLGGRTCDGTDLVLDTFSNINSPATLFYDVTDVMGFVTGTLIVDGIAEANIPSGVALGVVQPSRQGFQSPIPWRILIPACDPDLADFYVFGGESVPVSNLGVVLFPAQTQEVNVERITGACPPLFPDSEVCGSTVLNLAALPAFMRQQDLLICA